MVVYNTGAFGKSLLLGIPHFLATLVHASSSATFLILSENSQQVQVVMS